jgi:hypothetical protein
VVVIVNDSVFDRVSVGEGDKVDEGVSVGVGVELIQVDVEAVELNVRVGEGVNVAMGVNVVVVLGVIVIESVGVFVD